MTRLTPAGWVLFAILATSLAVIVGATFALALFVLDRLYRYTFYMN